MARVTGADRKRVISLLQGMIALLSGIPLKIDGVVGPRTYSAYQKLTPEKRSIVRFAGEKFGVDIDAEFKTYSYRNRNAPARPRARTMSTASSNQATDVIKDKITATARRVGVNPELALTVAQMESQFNPNAVSSTGAAGIFQLTSAAIAQIGIDPPNGDRFDIDWNIDVGVRYLKWCASAMGVSAMSSSHADWAKIYGAYNIGVGGMRTALGMTGGASRATAARLVNYQAARLKRGGLYKYPSNVEAYVRDAHAVVA